MTNLLSRLSNKTLLILIMAIPLAGLLYFGGQGLWSGYRHYDSAREAQAYQQLASAGAEMARAVAAEGLGPAAQRDAARADTDAAFVDLARRYDALKARNLSDPVLEETVRRIGNARGEVDAYRDLVDDPSSAPELIAMSSGKVMQPISAAGISIARRVAAVTDDIALSRLIQGYHAAMQVNDAGLMERDAGASALGKGDNSLHEKRFVTLSSGLFSSYLPVMMEFLPAEITQAVTKFNTTPEAAFQAEMRPHLYSLEPFAGPSTELAGKWAAASLKLGGVYRGVVDATGGYIDEYAQSATSAAFFQLVSRAAVLAVIVLAALALSGFSIRAISGIVSALVNRMTALAQGETQTEVPCVDRTDDFGTIAHAVEHFRQAAIEKNKLEEEAAASRARSEQEREDIQRQAAEDADRRLKEATGAMAGGLKRLADGDLLCEIDEPFAPEFEDLRADFNASVRQLREAFASVGETAGDVHGGSREIASSVDNLARRTEQQAASLEETAAAMEQITANVQGTSKRSSEARTLVRDAREKAEGSAGVVRNAVEAMQRIEQSSRQINQIIGVIDEIAFQTNLLALNAGVEAARAGEAGQGFAVVAQEVRELAQRSANAAKEIKGLISNSGTAVEEGVKLVDETGAGLAAIEEAVRSVNEHMEAIANAAAEQATGLSEISQAVNQMDESTQQNAAMVEQMNAASAEMASKSSHLQSLVERFRTVAGDTQPLKTMAQTMRAANTQSSASRPASGAARQRVTAAIAGNTAVAGDWEEF